VIAVERYMAIAHPLSHGAGSGRMSRRRALLVIAGVWACSAAISFVPIYAGWFADLTSMRLYSDTAADCGLHVNRVYAVVSSATSFYLPLRYRPAIPKLRYSENCRVWVGVKVRDMVKVRDRVMLRVRNTISLELVNSGLSE